MFHSKNCTNAYRCLSNIAVRIKMFLAQRTSYAAEFSLRARLSD